MRAIEDLTGQRFGRLTVIEQAPRTERRIRWTCRCDCGQTTTTRAESLQSGHTRSCGCARVVNMKQVGESNAERERRISVRVSQASRIEMATAAIFRAPPDTKHVDRPGARVVRGGRY